MASKIKSSLVVLLSICLLLSSFSVFSYAESEEPVSKEAEVQETVTQEEEPEVISEEAQEESADDKTTDKKSDEVQPESEKEVLQDTKKAPLKSGNSDCYLDAFVVKSQKDGTAPWDEDDSNGNDTGPNNGKVRTFDDIMYTFEYTTAISGNTVVNSADLNLEFTLATDPSIAVFNDETLAWMRNKVVTYHYSDGTTSTSWDQSKTVTKQVLTGIRHIENSSSSNAIPGVGMLVAGVKIKAAKNGDIIKPSYKAWISGDDKKSITGDDIQVTAAPRYNLKLYRDGNTDYLAYWDLDTMTPSQTKAPGLKYGRFLTYGVAVQLYNTSIEKGLKGIEIPKGDIEYDIHTASLVNGVDETAGGHHDAYLYDFRPANNNPNANAIGNLGRDMTISGNALSVSLPRNIGGTTTTYPGRNYSYNGGDLTVTQITPNHFHVKVKDYKFDMVNFIFPTHDWNSNTQAGVVYRENVGSFSTGLFSVIATFPDQEEAESMGLGTDYSHKTLNFRVQVGDLSANSITNQHTDTDQLARDNTNSYQLVMMPRGTWNKWCYIYRKPWNTLTHVASSTAGDAAAVIGEELRFHPHIGFSGDGYLNAVNILSKFDDEGFEIPAGTTDYAAYASNNAKSEKGDVKTLFAAKPDKTGWTSDDEMRNTHEADLVYFDTIDELNAAGYTCVGFLFEIRNAKIYPNGGTNTLNISMGVKTKTTAEIGKVYAYMHEAKLWRDDVNTYSYSDHREGNHYRDANPNYPATTMQRNSTYEKSIYEDGVVVNGHIGGYLEGQSVLIIGDQARVSISTEKNVYDLDIGERTATFKIKPSLSVETANGFTDDVTVKAILPKDLTYIVGSATRDPQSVETVDGVTTITWLYKDVEVNSAMEPVDIQCIIGHAGTSEDVHNNDIIPITATAQSGLDKRVIHEGNGNKSSTSISVIRLAATSISKEVDKPLLEREEDFTFTLRYGNNAEEDASNIQIYDVLPYNEDDRGTAYHGYYAITGIEIDFTQAPKTLQAWDGTVGVAQRGLDIHNNLSAYGTFNGTRNGNKIVYAANNAQPPALLCKFSKLFGEEYLAIYVHCHPVHNMAEDIYVNKFSQNASTQAAPVVSNPVQCQVVDRTIKGLVFTDKNVNGVRDEGDETVPDREVRLYTTVNNGNTPITIDGTTYYPAKDVSGKTVGTTKTDKNGVYTFTNLPAGNYVVILPSLGDYVLTDKNVGDDRTVDSDGEPITYLDSSAIIKNITLPAMEDMTSPHYLTDHNDFGLYLPTRQVIITTNVTGDLGDLSKEFEFALKFTSPQKITWAKGDDTGEYTGTNFAFKLKDGESITTDIPIGSKYTLTESANDHIASYKITSDSEDAVIVKNADMGADTAKALSTAEETVDALDGITTITVSNNRDLATVTGSAYRAYILLAKVFAVAIAGIFAIAVISRKKKWMNIN